MYARPTLADAIMPSNWETRGWTLQEKFFSKRLLFFTKHQVYYQCADALWAEDAVLEPEEFHKPREHSTKQRTALNQAGRPHSDLVLRRTPNSTATDDSGSDLLDFFQYQDLLQEYARRDLTHDTDILAAFSGILNNLSPKLGPSVFGLPERIFDASLLWYSDPSAKRRPQFPIWSWYGWTAGEARKLSLLAVAEATQDDAYAWNQPHKKQQQRSIEIKDFGSATVKIHLPRPLISLSDLTLASGSSYASHFLEFEAGTFFDPKYISDEVQVALSLNKASDRRSGRTVPYILEFVVMSAARPNDTWFKRRNGTYALPPAPGFGSRGRASVNLMLIKTDEHQISERVWVFSAVMGEDPAIVRKTIYLS